MWDVVSLLLLTTTIIATLIFGSYISVSFESTVRRWMLLDDENESVTQIYYKFAIAFPVIGSVTLLLLFFYFGFLSQLLLLVVCTVGFLAIMFCFYPIVTAFFPSLVRKEVSFCCCKMASIYYILGIIALTCILLWLFTGNALFNNIIAISWCILSLSLYRVPNLKIATIALVGLFFYDIFWVFFSHHFFGKNVMTEVATKQTANPMNTIAQTLHVSTKVVQELQLPMVLIVGQHRLGLGDIVLPGILLTYALKIDTHFKQMAPFWNGYFLLGLCGYLIGFQCAFIALTYYEVAQPALLYLVPLTLLPIIFLSLKRKEFLLVWNGMSKAKKENDVNLV